MSVLESAAVEEGCREDRKRLIRLIEEHRVEDARRLAPELAARWPDSPEIQHLAKVLEPPKILPSTPGPPGRSFKLDHQWMKEHGHEYPGCWIATLENRLIAADPSPERVLEVVKRSVDLTREMPLLQYQVVPKE